MPTTLRRHSDDTERETDGRRDGRIGRLCPKGDCRPAPDAAHDGRTGHRTQRTEHRPKDERADDKNGAAAGWSADDGDGTGAESGGRGGGRKTAASAAAPRTARRTTNAATSRRKGEGSARGAGFGEAPRIKKYPLAAAAACGNRSARLCGARRR